MNKSYDDLTLETFLFQEFCCSSQWDNEKIHSRIVPLAEKDESRDEVVHNDNTWNEKLHIYFLMGNDVNIVGNVENVRETLDIKCKDIISTIDESKSLTLSVDESEPIYEGEEHLQETITVNYDMESKDPMHEGEVVLAKKKKWIREEMVLLQNIVRGYHFI